MSFHDDRKESKHMDRRQLLGAVGALGAGLAAGACQGADTRKSPANPEFLHPLIKDYGGIVPVPAAVEPPRKGARVVFDITAAGRTAEGVLNGLNTAARVCNQYAHFGVGPKDGMKVAVVLHGDATGAALKDEAHARHLRSPKNPDLELIRRLHAAGVEVLVCGQALAHHHYAADEVAPEVQVAASAAAALINHQMAGYAYIPIL
jgi:intracellular sulfur oxidation DsrE/DsrF family protein